MAVAVVAVGASLLFGLRTTRAVIVDEHTHTHTHILVLYQCGPTV